MLVDGRRVWGRNNDGEWLYDDAEARREEARKARLRRVEHVSAMYARGHKVSEIVAAVGLSAETVAKYIVESLNPDQADWQDAQQCFREHKYARDIERAE